MTDISTPKEARGRALLSAERAARCASPKAQARFASITKNWIALAFELEQRSNASDEKRRHIA